jgi:hypothetical protein
MMFGDFAAGFAEVTTDGAGVGVSGAGVVSTTGATSAAGASVCASSVDFFAAFFAGARLAAAFFTGFGSSPSVSVFLAAFFAAFFTGFGSSGCCSRINPSRSARARTRSACCSMIVEESPLTPIDNFAHKSRVS